MALNHKDLAAALRAGDTQAFADFFNAYADPIYRLVAGLVQNDAEAEDIVQEVFLKLLDPFRRLQGRSPAKCLAL